jgi:hypothetical protein
MSRAERNRRYKSSEKGKASIHRANHSPAGKARRKRYEERRKNKRVHISVGNQTFSYQLPTEELARAVRERVRGIFEQGK